MKHGNLTTYLKVSASPKGYEYVETTADGTSVDNLSKLPPSDQFPSVYDLEGTDPTDRNTLEAEYKAAMQQRADEAQDLYGDDSTDGGPENEGPDGDVDDAGDPMNPGG